MQLLKLKLTRLEKPQRKGFENKKACISFVWDPGHLVNVNILFFVFRKQKYCVKVENACPYVKKLPLLSVQ